MASAFHGQLRSQQETGEGGDRAGGDNAKETTGGTQSEGTVSPRSLRSAGRARAARARVRRRGGAPARSRTGESGGRSGLGCQSQHAS